MLEDILKELYNEIKDNIQYDDGDYNHYPIDFKKFAKEITENVIAESGLLEKIQRLEDDIKYLARSSNPWVGG